MDPKSQPLKGRDGAFSMLNEAMEDLSIAKETSCIASAKAVFGSVSDLLPTIRVSPLSVRIRRSIVG